MRFGKDARDSYILQLKLLHAIMPDALAYEDESAEKYMNKRWVELVVNSKYPCEFDSLYSVQAVIANDDDIWLHTHGLARCNIAELENIAGDTLDLTLTQEPYDIKDLHQGYRGKYLLADLTNWVIYTPNGTFTPESVYLLDL